MNPEYAIKKSSLSLVGKTLHWINSEYNINLLVLKLKTSIIPKHTVSYARGRFLEYEVFLATHYLRQLYISGDKRVYMECTKRASDDNIIRIFCWQLEQPFNGSYFS